MDIPEPTPAPQVLSATFYNRLEGAGHFKTAMTRPRPNGNKSFFIHPQQKRALSLREFARSQGFNDDYTLRSSHPTPAGRLADVSGTIVSTLISELDLGVQYFKLIGNAVPLPLAAALGRSIGSALIHDWRERCRREGSIEI